MSLKEAFDFIDHDNDGYIGVSDIKRVFDLLDEPICRAITDFVIDHPIDWPSFVRIYHNDEIPNYKYGITCQI